MISFIPFLVLIVLITCCVAVFGNATLDGASQVSLLAASAVSVLIGHFTKRLEWENLEKELTDKIASCTPAIIILLLIGAIGGICSRKCRKNSVLLDDLGNSVYIYRKSNCRNIISEFRNKLIITAAGDHLFAMAL